MHDWLIELACERIQRVGEGREVVHVGAEDEVGELSEREEHDEEHDSETDQVRHWPVDGERQRAQRPREVNVLEQLRTIRYPDHRVIYDTIRDAISTRAHKLTLVSLIYRTQPTTKMWKTEKLKSKNGYADKYW